MKNDNNNIDLDDFWAELINKSEWAKNSALKTPGEFRNLNILGSRKKNIILTPPEKKVEQPQGVILKKQETSTKHIVLKIVLVTILILFLFASLFIIAVILLDFIGIHLNIWNFRYG